MQITDPITNPRLAVEEIKNQALQQLRPGQLLSARVTQGTTGDLARISIGKHEIAVSTTVRLSEGEQLTINVIRGGERPEFRIVRPLNLQEVKAQALRDILPRQQPLAGVADRLNQLLTQSGAQPARAATPAPPPGIGGNPPTNPQQQIPGTQSPPATAPSPNTDQNQVQQILSRLIAQMSSGDGRQQSAGGGAKDTPGLPLKGEALAVAIRLLSAPGSTLSPALVETVQRQLETLLASTPANSRSQPGGPVSTAEPRPASGTPPGVTAESASARSIDTPTPLPTRVQEQIRILLTQIGLADDQPLTPERLRQALDQSGLFLEGRLAMGQVPAIDLKSSLLRLLFALRPALAAHPSGGEQRAEGATQQLSAQPPAAQALRSAGDLQGQVEGALARIGMHQLASLPNDQDMRQVWQFDLPVRHQEQNNGFLIRIEKENKPGQPPEQALWSVLLNFDLEPGGPISTRIALLQDEVSSHFIAERRESAIRIEQYLPQLEKAFVAAGLRVKQLSVKHGKPVEPPAVARMAQRILDERA